MTYTIGKMGTKQLVWLKIWAWFWGFCKAIKLKLAKNVSPNWYYRSQTIPGTRLNVYIILLKFDQSASSVPYFSLMCLIF